MRVKRLEIQGFKSFKDKTVIHFDHGITGIVGPNGCGKSNIVDAFFWVMGEQSYKHMRGSGSDDLIFNGSSKYSALGLAEATLTLETDFEDPANAPAGATSRDIPLHLRSREVAITRRLYRGGEGEYLINGVPARLRDIQEFFMDTGVGAKGYSVIEQGQIGKIVNSKPEERRLLVEEAAGIAKYKARKKESLRKMEATEANLARLADVIAEIERSMNSLERQAQKARQYRKLKDELIENETSWGRRKSLVLRRRLDQLKSEREALEVEVAGLKAALQTRENESETDLADQLILTKNAEEWQLKIQDLSDEHTRERSALELSRQRQADIDTQIQSLGDEERELGTSIETAKAEIVSLQTEASHGSTLFENATARARALEEQTRSLRREIEEKRRVLESMKSEVLQGLSRTSDLQSRVAVLGSKIESSLAKRDELSDLERETLSELDQAQGSAERSQFEAASLETRVEALEQEKKNTQAALAEDRAKIKDLEGRSRALATELAQTRSRLESSEELVAAYEGFGDGPRAALDWSRAQPVAPLRAMADLYAVTPGYESALENWLDDRFESLIASDADAALAAVELLREKKQGRVCIQLASQNLQRVSPVGYEALQKQLNELGLEVIGRLTDFVKVSESGSAAERELAEDWVDQVCVVRSLGRRVLEKNPMLLGGWSLVDLDGSVLDSVTGAFRGGSQARDEATSLLHRKRLVAELSEAVARLSNAFSVCDAELEHAKGELERRQNLLQSLQADAQQVAIELASTRKELSHRQRVAQDTEARLSRTRAERQKLESDATAWQDERSSLEAEVTELSGSKLELENEIVVRDQNVKTGESELRNAEDALQTAKVEEASLRERSGSLRRELDAGLAMITDREKRRQEVARNLARLTQERAQFSGGENDLEQKISGLTQELNLARDQLSSIKDRLEIIGARLREAQDASKTLKRDLESRTDRMTQATIDVERMQGELAHLVQNLEEKYGPGCLERPVAAPIQEEMTEPVVTLEMSEDEEKQLGELVEQLREKIRRLGEVNPSAIEEFEEVKRRFDHLQGEKLDLERSIENLKDAIDHINKTSEDRFQKAFEAIKVRFEKLFPIIFGGGSAELTLVYPEGSTDILEAGVDILAQPPGKKVSNITLLSGGEKALTAVSLIFAIFMVKPSPFCVLDEVDAPLDDANIGKFNALLKEMAVKSQFIIITHNKKTMELNDTLYGVTMEEPGVSKMVSIEMQ